MQKRALTALALAGALALGACGDDDDDDAAADTTMAEQTATTMAGGAVTTMASEGSGAEEAMGTIVDVASSTDGFSTLVAAVTAADLAETLSGDGPFTVFAPTDDAFAALPAGVLDALLLPENKETLAKILTYHVLPAEVLAADVTAGEVDTVEGQPLTIATDGGVTVNGANVTTTDVMASNGVIHVIDAVLIPPDVDPASLTG